MPGAANRVPVAGWESNPDQPQPQPPERPTLPPDGPWSEESPQYGTLRRVRQPCWVRSAPGRLPGQSKLCLSVVLDQPPRNPDRASWHGSAEHMYSGGAAGSGSVCPGHRVNPRQVEIADRLDVGAILQGSVQRDGTRLRIQAQLVDTATDLNRWAEAATSSRVASRGCSQARAISHDPARLAAGTRTSDKSCTGAVTVDTGDRSPSWPCILGSCRQEIRARQIDCRTTAQDPPQRSTTMRSSAIAAAPH